MEKKKILVTGAAGFLGRGLIIPFEEHGYELRLMDVAPFESRHEVIVGSVADYDTVEKAVEGVHAIVIAHMAPWGKEQANYKLPTMPIDINVKGTAHVFHAAVKHGVKKVVVISSEAAVSGNPDELRKHDSPLRAKGYYGLTKVCQEAMAEQFSREHAMQVACLRPGYILDADTNTDKYGRVISERAPADADRRDIGEVARLCIESPTLAYDVFHVMSTWESMTVLDVQHTSDTLGWKPKYDFSWLPTHEEAKKQQA